MFALYALAGDAGCALGPTVVGRVAAANADNLKSGITAALVFPVCMGIALLALALNRRKKVILQ